MLSYIANKKPKQRKITGLLNENIVKSKSEAIKWSLQLQ